MLLFFSKRFETGQQGHDIKSCKHGENGSKDDGSAEATSWWKGRKEKDSESGGDDEH